MKSIVKVQWRQSSKGWKANLFLASKEGFEKRGLEPGRDISFEIEDQRRCTGYAPVKGERAPCPEFREIEKGSQCPECRGKDIYSGYVRGEENDLDGEFSVYLAQIGTEVKVGVTRKEKIPKRWIEQGADYGAEVFSGISSNEALEKEEELTSEKITQRIRKEHKTDIVQDPSKLRGILEKKNFEAEIVDVQSLTVYPEIGGEFARRGLLEGEIQSVKGQIVSNGRLAMAMTSGKVLKQPEQKGLDSF
jgi:predicted Zn-ribbon and HTH transcriptional regulator